MAEQRRRVAAIYVRGQGQEDPGLVEQQRRCEDYARAQGLDLAGVFRDFGSGPTEGTEQLGDRIRDREIDAILMAGGAGQLGELGARAREQGIEVIAVP